MRYLRFEKDGRAGFGVLEGEDIVRELRGEMFGAHEATGSTFPLSSVRLLPPADPPAMIALWTNSRQVLTKINREPPKEALYFLKPRTCYATHGDAILYPVGKTEKLLFEAELGVVIGKPCRNVSVEQAREYIFGYTAVNDVTAMDVVMSDPVFLQCVRGKGYDSFGVFGPWIETEVDDPYQLRIQATLSGQPRQDYPVTDLLFGPYEAVADISRAMPLMPGDVIALGTGLGVKPMKLGDTIEVVIPGVGSLVNQVVAGA